MGDEKNEMSDELKENEVKHFTNSTSDMQTYKIEYLPTIVNALFIKPIDEVLLLSLCESHERIITLEEGVLAGGFGSAGSGMEPSGFNL